MQSRDFIADWAQIVLSHIVDKRASVFAPSRGALSLLYGAVLATQRMARLWKSLLADTPRPSAMKFSIWLLALAHPLVLVWLQSNIVHREHAL